MTKDERQITPQEQPQIQSQQDESEQIDSDPLATGLGVVGGGFAGAALGRSIGGKMGAAIGGLAANKLAEYVEEFTEELEPTVGLGLGANHKPIELPSHYTWEELQALSKPQGEKMQAT